MRAILEKRPAISLGVVAVCLLAAVMLAVHFMGTSGGRSVIAPSTYFTSDDGKTLFEDNDPHDIPPFEHDGREAVQAYMIPGRTPGSPGSIWYLVKFTDARKGQTQAMADGPGSAPPKAGAKPFSPFSGQLIKRPGDGPG